MAKTRSAAAPPRPEDAGRTTGARRHVAVALLACFLCAFSAGSLALDESDPPFRLVVHVANPFTELPQRFVDRAFLKKNRSWIVDERAWEVDGRRVPILPVNQLPKSAVRATFSRAVHGRAVGRIESLWQRMIFSGKGAPPDERGSDAAVIDFVAANPGAIGYVSSSAKLGDGAKEIEIQ